MSERDRRAQERHAPDHLPATISFHQPLQILDISESGVRVETSEWLAPGRRYNLRLGQPPLQVAGLVIRSMLVRVEQRDGGARPVFEAGLRFDSPAPAAHQHILQLVAQLAAREDDELPALRIAAR